MKRWIGRILVATAITVLATVATQEPSHAAPARSDSNTENVYFVHGYAAGRGGWDVCLYWCNAIYAVDAGDRWSGALHGVGYYAADTNYSVRMSTRTHETPIKELGRDLAWMVYNLETVNGRSVDLVGHSMGGLIIRAALTGVARREAGFPATLYVEDVVTFATPHLGTSWAQTCPTQQCMDMRPGSGFLQWLLQGPQSTQGTDWTLVGADNDDIVTEGSATGMSSNVGHKHIYHTDGMEHDRIHHWSADIHSVTSWHHYTRTWTTTSSGWAPLTGLHWALYYWSRE
jgi:triacylglycerol esterase/lipase EstA (alpha/beta hydrolase family)